MTRRQVREEDVGKMEIDFQCVVLKAYGANTEVLALLLYKKFLIFGLNLIKGNHTTAVCRSPKPFMGVRIPLPLFETWKHILCFQVFYDKGKIKSIHDI